LSDLWLHCMTVYKVLPHLAFSKITFHWILSSLSISCHVCSVK
jgi:hypothetical protein